MPIELKELKEIESRILEYVINICKTEEITYFVAAGTLLGAIRHSDFIPWDDDVDIMMPRSDYVKFIQLLQTKYLNNQYKCLSMYHQKDYYYPFAKVVDLTTNLIEKDCIPIMDLGVYIDVFPIDGAPNNIRKCEKLSNNIMKLRDMHSFSIMERCTVGHRKILYPIKWIIWKYSRIRGWKYWLKRVENKITHYKYYDSNKVTCYVSGYKPIKETNDRLGFRPINVRFGDLSVAAPYNYKEYLSGLYGDYMKLPPIEDRKPHHSFIAEYK